MNTLLHPPAELLRAFLAGRLAQGEAEPIEAHLLECAQCGTQLSSLDEGGDPLLTCLRAAEPPRADTWHLDLSLAPAAPGEDAPEAPQRILHYEIERELGRGGMGRVYLAYDPRLRRSVAIKVLTAGSGASSEERSRFRAEALAVARLQHPHIIQVYEVGEWQGQPFLALEYLEGGTLRDRCWLRPLAAAEAADLLIPLAEALHYAHQQGVIHRDLKPANVLLTGPHASPLPKLSDFGLAKLRGLERTQVTGIAPTETGTLVGTPAYMAPELVGNPAAAGPATDLYGLGAVLYEMVTGRPPFTGHDPVDVLSQVVNKDPVPPRRLSPNLPRDLETICLCCLAKEPHRRYGSAQALADDLVRWRRGEAIRARPLGPWGRLMKWARRRPAIAGLSAAMVLAGLLLLATAGYYQRHLEQALAQAQSAERAAAASAESRAQQLEVALRTMDRFVNSFQEKMEDVPGAREVQQAVLDAALAGLRELSEVTGQAAPDLRRVQAHFQLGQLLHNLGRQSEARRQYELAVEIAAALLERAANADRAEAVVWGVRAQLYLARLETRANRPTRAREMLQSAQGWLASLPPNQPRLERLLRLWLLDGMSEAAHWAGDWSTCRAELAQALPMLEEWLKETPQDEKAQQFGERLLVRWAEVLRIAGRGEEAQQVEQRAAALLGKPRTLAERRNHLVRFVNEAVRQFEENQLGSAIAAFQQAVTEARELLRLDPLRLQHEFDLAHQLYNLGYAERLGGLYTPSRVHLREAKVRLDALAAAGKLQDQAGMQHLLELLQGEMLLHGHLPAALLWPDYAWLCSTPMRWWLLAERACYFSWLGDEAEALRTWRWLVSYQPVAGAEAELARVLAAACRHLHLRYAESAALRPGSPIHQDLANRAVALLAQAIRAQPDLARHLDGDAWRPLRDHPEFAKVRAGTK